VRSPAYDSAEPEAFTGAGCSASLMGLGSARVHASAGPLPTRSTGVPASTGTDGGEPSSYGDWERLERCQGAEGEAAPRKPRLQTHRNATP
jgi:hypothetical protein